MLILWSLKKQLEELTELATKCSYIDPELFVKYQVKRGLRDLDGKGVLVGLTEIGEVHSYIIDENEIVPVPGRLIYRGIDIFDLVDGFISEGRLVLKKLHICCFSVICRPGNS